MREESDTSGHKDFRCPCQWIGNIEMYFYTNWWSVSYRCRGANILPFFKRTKKSKISSPHSRAFWSYKRCSVACFELIPNEKEYSYPGCEISYDVSSQTAICAAIAEIVLFITYNIITPEQFNTGNHVFFCGQEHEILNTKRFDFSGLNDVTG